MSNIANNRPELPVDSDVEVASSPSGQPRPVHLSGRYIGIVALGGVVGTAAREALTLVLPHTGELSAAIFGINVLGALILGALLETLASRGPDEGRRRTVRLLFGTGVMGGLTTYSTLATGVAQAIISGDAVAGVGYGAGTLLIGSVATFIGIIAAASFRRRANTRQTR